MKIIYSFLLVIGMMTISIEKSAAIVHSEAIAYTDSAEIALNRGKEFAKRGLFDRAIAEFSSVIKSTRKNLEAYMNRALAFESMQLYSDAIKDFGFIVKHAPENDFMHIAAKNHRGRMWQLIGIKELSSKDTQPVKPKDQFELKGKFDLDKDLLAPSENR